MARLFPFRALLYNHSQAGPPQQTVAPLFDVVDKKLIRRLYRLPYNSMKLTIPLGSLTPRDMGALVYQWLAQGILYAYPRPAVYPYFQDYRDPISGDQVCRKGFVAEIEVEPWNTGSVQAHEETLPHSMDQRMEVLEKTNLVSSPTHGLYSGGEEHIEPLLQEAIDQHLLVDYTDHREVRHRLAVLAQEDAFKTIQDVMAPKSIILADGHHRYSAAVAFKERWPVSYIHHHMMYFTGLETNHARIYPTHRMVYHLEGFSIHFVLQILKGQLQEIGYHKGAIDQAFQDPETALIVMTQQKAYRIGYASLLEEKVNKEEPKALSEWLHYDLLEKQMGIPREEQRSEGAIAYAREADLVMEKVFSGQAKAGFLLKALDTNEVRKAGQMGKIFPPKTTYFYPKTLTGLLLHQIRKR